MRLVFCALVVLFAIASSGCTAKLYKGPELPDSELATLTLVRPHPNMSYSAVNVDGESTSSTVWGFTTDLEITPGPHTLAFRARFDQDSYCDAREHLCPSEGVNVSCRGEFVAERGRGYAVEIDSTQGVVSAFIRPARTISNIAVGRSDTLTTLTCDQASELKTVDTENADQF